MNNAAVYATARLAALHRADIARQVEAGRTARLARRTRTTGEPTVTETPAPRRGGWTRWILLPRQAHG